jgi:undecaprenyl-phosphate 4-deoxy-4-formamido-L-arabinose transferase
MIENYLKPGISVVIPVYNSSQILPEFVERLAAILPILTVSFEVILVNDGSHDESWKVIENLSDKYEWVRGLRLMRNYGQHNALLAGIRAAIFDVTLTMDDDLQHPPEQIPKLFHNFDADSDVIYGVPEKEPHGLLRGIASRLIKISLRYALGAAAARNVSAFRIFRTKLRSGFNEFHSPFVSIDVLLTWSTKRFSAEIVQHQPRSSGSSNYNFFRLLQHAATLMTGFSVWPLQMASLLGFTITIFGLVVFLYVVTNYFLNGSSVAGFPFLASIIAIFSGAQMFALGIMGEYLARMHFRLLDRPAYVVAEDTKKQ